MTSESTTTVYGYLLLPSSGYCTKMTLRCAFCAHNIAHLLDLSTNFPHTVVHPACFSVHRVQNSDRRGEDRKKEKNF